MIPPSTKRETGSRPRVRSRAHGVADESPRSRQVRGRARARRGEARPEEIGAGRERRGGPRSVNFSARARDASLLTLRGRDTSCPAATRVFPMVVPIPPGGRSPTIMTASVEAEPQDARPAPRVDGDDTELVRARGEAAGVEAEADADRAGTVALGLGGQERTPRRQRAAEHASLRQDRDRLARRRRDVAVSRVCYARRASSARGGCDRRRARRVERRLLRETGPVGDV